MNVAHIFQYSVIYQLGIILFSSQQIHSLPRYSRGSEQSSSGHNGSPDEVSSVYFFICTHHASFLKQRYQYIVQKGVTILQKIVTLLLIIKRKHVNDRLVSYLWVGFILEDNMITIGSATKKDWL